MVASKHKNETKSATKAPAHAWLKRVIGVVLFIGTCWFLDTIKERWYVFDPASLHELSQAAIAASPNNTEGMINHIVANLTATYPSTTIALNTNTKEWVWNNAGGAMGMMYIIHASITEYLIIFGTPLGTEGHSGMHTADDYFNILVGEQWAADAGQLEMQRYPAGSVNFMPRGHVRQYKMHKGCFALEYARGWIPLMLPFGYADAFSSTLDVVTIFWTTWNTGREIIRNLLIGKI